MITPERAQTIILCYGGCPSAWPKHERRALEALLSQSESLRALQKQSLSIDEFMGFVEPDPELFDRQTALCAERIMAGLPRRRRPVVRKGYRKHRPSYWRAKITRLIKTFQQYEYPVYWLSGLALAIMLMVNISSPETHAAKDLTVAEYMAFYQDDSEQDDGLEGGEEIDMLAFLEPQLWDEDETL